MCCLKFLLLFVCILCTKYLLGDLNSNTLNVLMENYQENWDDIEIVSSLNCVYTQFVNVIYFENRATNVITMH